MNIRRLISGMMMMNQLNESVRDYIYKCTSKRTVCFIRHSCEYPVVDVVTLSVRFKISDLKAIYDFKSEHKSILKELSK